MRGPSNDDGPIRFRLRRGLDLPIAGAPEPTIEPGPDVRTVGIVGQDYIGLRPSPRVTVGEQVKLGQTLFVDRREPELRFTSPGAGVVRELHRGEARELRSLVVELDGDEEERFDSRDPADLSRLPREVATAELLAAGLWTAFRTRPYGITPVPRSVPRSIFVTAIDTDPLAAAPEVVLCERADAFRHGLVVLGRLTDGQVYLCQARGAAIPTSDGITVAEFSGPHPSGLPGTHIHLLDPVGATGTVWHIGYADVVAIGELFTRGRLFVERVVALGGPVVERPRLLRTRLGASTEDLVRGELARGEVRVISGSLLSGRRAAGWTSYLGRFHTQVSAIREQAAARRGWLVPALGRCWRVPPARARAAGGWTTARGGPPRAMIPLGTFERVMPLDILPALLLRALVLGDLEAARELGCLELEEEDLALCTFLCPSNIEYGPLLRDALTQLARQADA